MKWILALWRKLPFIAHRDAVISALAKESISYQSRLKQTNARANSYEELLHHAWIHDNYPSMGFYQMSTEQKMWYIDLLRKWDCHGSANTLLNSVSIEYAKKIDPHWNANQTHETDPTP